MSSAVNSGVVGSQGKVSAVVGSSGSTLQEKTSSDAQVLMLTPEQIKASIAKVSSKEGPERVYHSGTVSLYTIDNPKSIVDEKIVSVFCIICGRKVPRSVFDIACGTVCREVVDGLIELPAQIPVELASALSPLVGTVKTEALSPPDGKVKSEGNQAQNLPKRKCYNIFFPLYTKNNDKRKVQEMLVRKFCVVCAEIIQRNAGSFDSIKDQGLRYRVSLGSEKNVFCSQGCIHRIRAILNDTIVKLPSETEKELLNL